MSDEPLSSRLARPDDYLHFVRLSQELGTGDPVQPSHSWTAEMMPTTLMFEDGPLVVGYVFVQPLAHTGYVRHVVLAPTHRGQGLGVAVMRSAASFLRAQGCVDWCLHVLPSNTPAKRLSERCGMEARYTSQSLQVPWTISQALPREAPMDAARPIDAMDDEAVEATFKLPRGQLASARARVGRTLIGLFSPQNREPWVGLACFDRRFPGASPFRVRRVTLAAPLLDALRPLALPAQTHARVMVDDHEELAALLLRHGAVTHHTITHMAGPLP